MLHRICDVDHRKSIVYLDREVGVDKYSYAAKRRWTSLIHSQYKVLLTDFNTFPMFSCFNIIAICPLDIALML